MKFIIINKWMIKTLTQSSVFISVNDNVLSVVSRDDEIEITTTCVLNDPVDDGTITVDDGTITVDSKKLLTILKSFDKHSDVYFNLIGSKLSIICDGVQSVIDVLSSTDCINPTSTETIEPITIPLVLVSKIKHAMAVKDVRYYLNSVLLEIKNQQLIMVATDGCRLSLSKHNFIRSTDCRIIIPSRTINVLSKIKSDEMIMYYTTNSITFSTTNIIVRSKIIDGEYPEYERIIPTATKNYWTFNKKQLLSVLKRSKKPVLISSIGRVCSILDTTIECSWHGDQSKQISFNIYPQYLVDVLKTVDDDIVRIDIGAIDRLVIINGDLTHVIGASRY
jgi:DNA polymerase-3 subunit beta